MPQTFYTQEEHRSLVDKYDTICRTLDRICRAKEKKENGVNKDFYAYIPIEIYRVNMQIHFVYDYLKDVKKHRSVYNLKFLDVGSGIGVVRNLAATRFNAYGIEIDEKLIKEQKNLFGDTLYVDKQDALKYNEYNKFDVIYYYCPIRDPKLEKRLERRIERQMKVGAILIANHKQDSAIERNKKFKRIADDMRIYEKITK